MKTMDLWATMGVLKVLLLSSCVIFLSAAEIHEVSSPQSWRTNDVSLIQVPPSLGVVRIILQKRSMNYAFACGFIYEGAYDNSVQMTNTYQAYVFGVILFPNILDIDDVKVVWSANRNKPVGENAIVQLTKDGNLILKDVNGTTIWSAETSNKSVVGMRITESGNLVLVDKENTTIWQSFDHPTDTLLPGQKLVDGQKLISRASPTFSRNSVTKDFLREGLYSFTVTPKGLFAFVLSDTPKMYYKLLVHGTNSSTERSYVRFMNGSLKLFILSAEPSEQNPAIPEFGVSAAEYLTLDTDGHLKTYQWNSKKWIAKDDFFTDVLGKCGYPMACGSLGICSYGKCNCPAGFVKENTGTGGSCSEKSPLSCERPHSLRPLKDVYYFNYVDYEAADLRGVDAETCQRACLNNCSCKVALFRYDFNLSFGNCLLPSPAFSLISTKHDRSFNSSAFIKIQLPTTKASSKQPAGKRDHRTAKILGSSLALFLVVSIIVGIWFLLLKRKENVEGTDDFLDRIQGMPIRFSYNELKAATENFHSKLGEGGFGAVFEGILQDGQKVAVKCLNSFNQGKKEFLAEVVSIGSIHHVNLVRLIGFCAEKSHRLLVYEYMCNGSLDKWIFPGNEESNTLDWQTLRKIILDIAKGLAYLHEECSQKIVHLDIKPQNILLDNHFAAKVSDFGLSKLIEKDQSNVVTTMRGTPGYMAPEWLSSMITEKVDVYSFGIVVLEMVCGRKNLDRCQPPEGMHLLSLLTRKAEEDRLYEMVNKNSDMQLHLEEVVRMIKTATWCIQSDFVRRPSMAIVVKVLEGSKDVESDLDYRFWTPPQTLIHRQENLVTSSSNSTSTSGGMSSSVISGPR